MKLDCLPGIAAAASLILVCAPEALCVDKKLLPGQSSTKVVHIGKTDVTCVDPHACCEESKQVIDILHKLVAAYSQGDLKTYDRYLDKECTLFKEDSKMIINGKTAVLDYLKHSFAEHAPGGPSPLVSLVIDQPFAKITKDTCVVTFFATKEVGGANPHKERAQVTDVFVKRADGWKKLHWSGRWEKLSDG